MFTNQDELVIPASRVKLIALAFGAGVFVIMGAWMLSVASDEGPRFTAYGLAAVVFFGLCGLYAVRRLVRPEPAVIINRDGIVDNASALGVGLIRWNEIVRLREYRFKNQTFLGILPTDLDRLLAQQSAFKRTAIRANVALGADPINIPQVVLPMRVADLLREIEQRFKVSVGA